MNGNTNREPETGYRALVERNDIGICEIRNDQFSYVNQQFAELFGYTPSELVGASPFAVLAEREYQAFREKKAALARGDAESVTAEHEAVRRDGNEITIEAHGTVVTEGSAPAYLGYVEDVTDEKRRERRFESIFHNTFQFAGLLDPDGTVLEANETALYFGGLDREDVIGKRLWDTYWVRSSEAARETVREAIERGRGGQQFRDEIRVRGEDRELVIDFSIRPITDEGGTVTRLIAEGHDITGRKERERERQTIIDRMTDAVVEVDEDWRFTLVDDRAEEIYGMDESALLGEHFWDVFADGLGTRWETVYRGVMEDREPATIDEHFAQLEGWFHVEVYPESDGGLAFYFQDVSGRKRHEERIAGLNETLSQCMEVESKGDICDVLTEAAQERLHLPIATVALVGEQGELRPAAQSESARDRLNAFDLLDRDEGIAWRAFTSGEPTVIEDPSPYLDERGPVDELIVHPLGRHGVLVAGSPSLDMEFVQTVAEDVRRAFDRIDRERNLQDRDELLEEQNESLNRLNRINNVVRSIDQVLVRASSRTEIERAVCEKLTAGDTYTFAWIGGYEAATDAVSPRESGGHQQGYLKSLSFAGADNGSEGPAETAVRKREPVIETDLLTDPPHEAWREKALRRGYRSVISIPLTYRDSLYGVLTVYSDRTELFDGIERQVLTELGETVGHAINAVESKQALVSDTVVDLELAIDLSDHPLKEFVARDPDREFRLENIVPTGEGAYRAYYRIVGAPPESYLSFVDRHVAVQDSQLISTDDESNLYESVITDESLLFWLLDRGAVPRSFTITRDGGRLRVELSNDNDIREFVDLLTEEYPTTELVANRERDRSGRPRSAFATAVEEQLTARQREVLQTAYFSGYFESPRERTGEEIATSLGVSAPTVSNHIRAGLRKLLGLLYEGDGGPR
ncbi:PAS domain S-box protein [Natrinema sp. 1APR25-10V2]|uniref:PAS domain S-box protein n=1 Tax=Natrinema sp. 1APR25-10V2 TaxID=2951081 RepID=UPI002875C8D9|nr:PAS domain S-box protein [Natrinema sp. 1APR25-10V2]MDS0475452.1 PAS domain S-box protein [Natrinema sp. 1APR25-10V2]